MSVMKRRTAVLLLLLMGLPCVFVLEEAGRTLAILDRVERERDTWQRSDEIIQQLNLHADQTIVDLGSGAGYFALKLAPRILPNGRVLAIDLRRQSLAFLWIRAKVRRVWNIHVIRGRADDPRLPRGTSVDAVLIANTYHELTAPAAILNAFYAAMRRNARLVVVDRSPRSGAGTESTSGLNHDMTRAAAEEQIRQHGFETIARDDRFIDRPGDQDLWWLLVLRKP
jgi:ubiquinone/menaquinone biosynthesis C-methylase UbiE